ncbi:phosphate acyltransferase PlsX [Marinicella rhabdoformis]|uniref:phosphate acyltransferase PlsX n=1 Tax=Marinicella rhabdoformis TaxID=2580566 RepID=UPI0015D061D8|nr:phosphate acyltransferase PlsX [Marinicella rhabdoformis]
MHQKTIAIDLMGGDKDPLQRLDAVTSYVRNNKKVLFQLFVEEAFYSTHAEFFKNLSNHIHIIKTPQQVVMSDTPFQVLKHKRNSTLSLAIKSVADGVSDAILTAGNTGALVAFAKTWLKPCGEIERPALATILPGQPKPTLLLDVGATLDYRADDLFDLAHLGAQAASKLLDCGDKPEVALLNVGTEHMKGNDAVQQADRLLQHAELNYVGFCEGTHLFEGFADVVCCDGFVGNITLKACEGMMTLMSQNSENMRNSRVTKLFKGFMASISGLNYNPSQYNGALLLGLDACVVKSHGNCDSKGFYAAIERAVSYLENT